MFGTGLYVKYVRYRTVCQICMVPDCMLNMSGTGLNVKYERYWVTELYVKYVPYRTVCKICMVSDGMYNFFWISLLGYNQCYLIDCVQNFQASNWMLSFCEQNSDQLNLDTFLDIN